MTWPRWAAKAAGRAAPRRGEGGGAGGTTSSSSTGSSSGSAGGGDGVTCPSQEKLCGGICKDVTSDPDHCGDCFNACGTEEDCINGQCPADDPGGSGGSGGSGGGTQSTCAPLAPEPVCGTGSRCAPQPNGFPTCVGPTGPGSQYAYCTHSSQCDSTHECVETSNYSFCLQWCVTDMDCPNSFDLCYPLQPAVYVGSQPWGVCYNGIS
ncbi:MAG: hypothetical protein JRI68_24930 [Deltaproteobacteria bacterium]|nr:hypothetical protein [Deltaproteobacteria bacterium]